MTIVRVMPEVLLYIPNNVVTPIISMAVGHVSSNGGFLDYQVEVTSGGESQVEIGQVSFLVNWNNVLEAVISRVNRQQLVSGGTIESTWSITPASPSIVSVVIASSLVPDIGFPRLTLNVHSLGRQIINVL